MYASDTPYPRDSEKFRKALITSVASSTAIETGVRYPSPRFPRNNKGPRRALVANQIIGSRNLEVEMIEVGGWNALFDTQDFNADNLIVGVIIENNTRLHLV